MNKWFKKFKEEKELEKKILEEKKKTLGYWGNELFDDFIFWGMPILILTLFYFGSFDARYGYDFSNNISESYTNALNLATNLTNEKIIMKFYDIGYRNQNFFYIWWFAVGVWICSCCYDLYRLIKLKWKKDYGKDLEG